MSEAQVSFTDPTSSVVRCRSLCVNISLKRLYRDRIESLNTHHCCVLSIFFELYNFDQTWYVSSLGKCASDFCSDKKFKVPGALKEVN